MTEESDLLGPGEVLGLERGVPKTRWNHRRQSAAWAGRTAHALQLLRLVVDHFDARFVRGAQSPILNGRSIIDLHVSIPLSEDVTLSVGGQNIADTFSDRLDLFADVFGLPYSQFTPWGLSGAYYYARLNYAWGR